MNLAFRDDDNLVGCLEYVHNDFFPVLETAMDGVAEELTTFGEKCK